MHRQVFLIITRSTDFYSYLIQKCPVYEASFLTLLILQGRHSGNFDLKRINLLFFRDTKRGHGERQLKTPLLTHQIRPGGKPLRFSQDTTPIVKGGKLPQKYPILSAIISVIPFPSFYYKSLHCRIFFQSAFPTALKLTKPSLKSSFRLSTLPTD